VHQEEEKGGETVEILTIEWLLKTYKNLEKMEAENVDIAK
jgi:hypothetical protein